MSPTPKIIRVIDGKKVEYSEEEQNLISDSDDHESMSIPEWKRELITKILLQTTEQYKTEFQKIKSSEMPEEFYKITGDFIRSVEGVIDNWVEAEIYDKKPGRPENKEANTEVMKVISDFAFKNMKNGILRFPSAEYVHDTLTKFSYERIRNGQEKIQVLSERHISNILKTLNRQ